MQGDDNIHFETMTGFSTNERKVKAPIEEREYFSLYDELEEKCHPDRYLKPFNQKRFDLANELYAELQRRSRRDDNSLIDIREKAIAGLGIHISTRRCSPTIKTGCKKLDDYLPRFKQQRMIYTSWKKYGEKQNRLYY